MRRSSAATSSSPAPFMSCITVVSVGEVWLAAGMSSKPISATSCGQRSFASASARRSEEHTSELQSLMRISYAVFCLKKKNIQIKQGNVKTRYTTTHQQTEHTQIT